MELTEAQRAELNPVLITISDALNAQRDGDMDTYFKLLKKVPVPAHTLMSFKRCGHADFIRRYELDTSLADAEYGPGWLDREDE